METISKHPLYITADKLTRAFILAGFKLYDNGETPEIETAEKAVKLCSFPEEFCAEPILLEGGYALRSELLSAQLTKMKGALPLKAFALGRTYDRRSGDNPCHLTLEGVIADKGISMADLSSLWTAIVKETYGVSARVELTAESRELYKLAVTLGDDSFTLGYLGALTWMAKALLDVEDPGVDSWLFKIDVDTIAMRDFDIASREELYSPIVDKLSKYKCSCPSYGSTFGNKARNILRAKGFTEFSGIKIYEADCYKKMNMIQESWDTNNKGIQLAEPIGSASGLPTVLTPALEEAIAANYKAGVENCRIFEVGHIFLPNPRGDAPIEKIALSFGGYASDIDSRSFRRIVDDFLNEIGISNHFFIPTTMAIAYDLRDCWLVLDEKPNYLGGNFGGISAIAEKNHGIGTHAFMAQLELQPLKDKADSEYGFIPNELK